MAHKKHKGRMGLTETFGHHQRVQLILDFQQNTPILSFVLFEGLYWYQICFSIFTFNFEHEVKPESFQPKQYFWYVNFVSVSSLGSPVILRVITCGWKDLYRPRMNLKICVLSSLPPMEDNFVKKVKFSDKLNWNHCDNRIK